ncbi:MAG: hypothetical protein GC166_07065 [Alphaproteobacteria bacterium]|nr:hypothetical protein [Alphaproteobacteria bacterium]
MSKTITAALAGVGTILLDAALQISDYHNSAVAILLGFIALLLLGYAYWQPLSRLVHRLKGTVPSFDLMPLTEVLRTGMRQMVLPPNPENIPAWMLPKFHSDGVFEIWGRRTVGGAFEKIEPPCGFDWKEAFERGDNSLTTAKRGMAAIYFDIHLDKERARVWSAADLPTPPHDHGKGAAIKATHVGTIQLEGVNTSGFHQAVAIWNAGAVKIKGGSHVNGPPPQNDTDLKE